MFLQSSVTAPSLTAATRLRGSFSAIGSSIEGNAQKIANFGRNFTFGYTLPVTYGAKKVIDSFRETDDTLRRVAAVSDGAVTDFS